MEPFVERELIDSEELRRALHVFPSLRREVRLRILRLLHKNKRVTVRSIHGKLGLEQSLVSHHLAILRKYELVKTGKFKNFVYYSIECKRLAEIHFHTGCILELREVK